MKELTIIETLMLCFTLLSFVFSSLIFYIHSSHRKSFKGDIDLSIALIMFSVGFCVNTFNLIATPRLSMSVSNILGVMGFVVFNWGTRKFRHIKTNHILDISTVAAYIALYLIFMYGNDIKVARLMITSAFLVYYTVLILVQYYKYSEQNTIVGVIKMMFNVFLVVNLVRAIVYFTRILDGNFEIEVLMEITWLVILLITEIVVVTGLLIVRDQDELHEKSMLLSVLGHDLRAPFVSIHNISNLLLEADLTNEDKVLARMCNRASQNGLNLLSNIIDWSNFDINTLESDDELTSYCLYENLKEFFAPQEETHNVTVAYSVNDDFIIPIDDRILHTILRNIIGNAIQYSPAGEVVSVSMTRVEKEIIFTVSDRGEGIPEQQQKRLRANFNELTPRSSAAKGSGLGFYIVRKFMIAVNAKIEIEPNEPNGSVVILTFPI